MKWIIEKSRYLALIGVFGLLAGALLSFFYGAYKTVEAFKETILDYASSDYKLIVLFDCLDSFLVAIALLVISISVYELFIRKLDVPDWMIVQNLSELEAKFGFVIVPSSPSSFCKNCFLQNPRSKRFITASPFRSFPFR